MNNPKNEMHENAYAVRNALKRKARNPTSDFILRSQSFILVGWKREFSRTSFFRHLLREIRNLRDFRRVNPSMKKEQTARIFAPWIHIKNCKWKMYFIIFTNIQRERAAGNFWKLDDQCMSVKISFWLRPENPISSWK